MNEFHDNQKDRLERYLDDGLSSEERTQFEREIEDSPELQAEIRLQEQIDARMKSRFAPPEAAAPVLDDASGGASPAPASKPSRKELSWRGWIGMAAVIAICVIGGLYGLSALEQRMNQPSHGAAADRPVDPAFLYASIVDAGYTVDWVCESDEEFVATTMDKLGAPLLLRESPGMEVVGWKYMYGSLLSRTTQILLTRVEGDRVVVLLDAVDNDDGELKDPIGDELFVHRRTLGGVVLYEISPRSKSAVINEFTLAQDVAVDEPPHH